MFAEQASVYIPLSNTPGKLPSYLNYDSTSAWHIGALQAVALESMTISSRLRASYGGRGSLQDMEETINSTGKRRIAKLGLSIADPDVLSSKVSTVTAQAEKSGSIVARQSSEDRDDRDDILSSFDIDTFTKDYRIAGLGSRKKEHIFGRVESSRGEWSVLESGTERDPHDRFNEDPALQRYVSVHCMTAPLTKALALLFHSWARSGAGEAMARVCCRMTVQL